MSASEGEKQIRCLRPPDRQLRRPKWRGPSAACKVAAALAAALVPASQALSETPPPANAGPSPPAAASGDVAKRGSPAATGEKARSRSAARAAREARRRQPGNLIGHGGPVKAVASDQATARVLTGSFDYSLMAWSIKGDEPLDLARVTSFEGAVNAVAFIPSSNKWIAAGDDRSVWIGRFGANDFSHRLVGHEGKINALSVSEDGRFAVSSSWDRTARIWDLETAAPGPVLSGHTGPVNSAVFSADGETVYTASYDGTVVAWRRSDGGRLRTLAKHGWRVNVLARVLDGKSERMIMGALNGAVRVLDPISGAEVASLPAHQGPVLSIAVTPQPGLVATGSADGLIRIVRLGDWSVIEEFHNAYGPIWALAFIAGGTALYYGSLDDFAMRWQIKPRAAFEPVESQYPRRFQVGDGLSPGERQFARKCSVCHTLLPDDANRAGPTLHGVFGRRAGSVPSYPYSDALKGSGLVWNEETIGKLFELGPDRYTPGSKMPLQRITNPEIRAALIDFLKSATTGSGVPSEGGKSGQPRP